MLKKLLLASTLLLTATLIFDESMASNATKKKQPARAASSEPKYEEPPIRAGASITVVEYNDKKRLLSVQITTEPAVGPNITTPELLVDAIGIEDKGDRKAFVDNPRRFIGTEYVLQKDLKLLVPEF